VLGVDRTPDVDLQQQDFGSRCDPRYCCFLLYIARCWTNKLLHAGAFDLVLLQELIPDLNQPNDTADGSGVNQAA
jgi:hypothetical protein